MWNPYNSKNENTPDTYEVLGLETSLPVLAYNALKRTYYIASFWVIEGKESWLEYQTGKPVHVTHWQEINAPKDFKNAA